MDSDSDGALSQGCALIAGTKDLRQGYDLTDGWGNHLVAAREALSKEREKENKTQKRSQNPIGSRFPDSVKLNLNPRMHNACDTKRQPKANRNDTPRTSMDAKGVDNLHAWTIHITAPMQHYTNKHAMNPSVVHDLRPVPARG